MAKPSQERTTERVVMVLAALTLLGGLVSTIQNHGDDEDSGGGSQLLAKGSAAPPLSAISHAQPDKHITDADLRGKVVVLDFWGTWCPPCRIEAPRVRDVARRYEKDAGVVVLALNELIDGSGPEDRSAVEKFLRDEALEDLPVYYPPAGLADAFRVNAFPTLYVLDAKGKVRFSAVGEPPTRSLLDAVEEARKP